MVSQFVYDLCHAQHSVTSKLAENEGEAPGVVAKQLFESDALPKSSDESPNGSDTNRAYECGQWGQSRPSELFLKVSSTNLTKKVVN